MKGVGGKQAEPYETVVTVTANGQGFTDGDVIVFSKAFDNIPCGMVICVLGTVALNAQPATMWKVTCSKTQCVISLVDGAGNPLPVAYRDEEIRIGIIVHEQL